MDLTTSSPSWIDLPDIPNPGPLVAMVSHKNNKGLSRTFLVRSDTKGKTKTLQTVEFHFNINLYCSKFVPEHVNAAGTTPLSLDMFDVSSSKWIATGPILKWQKAPKSFIRKLTLY